MSAEPDDIASSMGGPEVKSDQFTLNGSVLSRPAACRTASAPVPFWSPTFRVTEERLAGEPEFGSEPEDDELLDDEQPATARPATATTVAAMSLGL
jgi:hypothetical protein